MYEEYLRDVEEEEEKACRTRSDGPRGSNVAGTTGVAVYLSDSLGESALQGPLKI